MRVLAAKDPDDLEMTALVGELCLKSPEFGRLWAKHPVTACVSGAKFFRHPDVGDFELSFEVLSLPDEPMHRVLLFTPDPGSAGERAVHLLAREVELANDVEPWPRRSTKVGSDR